MTTFRMLLTICKMEQRIRSVYLKIRTFQNTQLCLWLAALRKDPTIALRKERCVRNVADGRYLRSHHKSEAVKYIIYRKILNGMPLRVRRPAISEIRETKKCRY